MKSSSPHIIALIKITDYPEDVLDGKLYCNRLKKFREIEREEVGDDIEGIAISKNISVTYQNGLAKFDKGYWLRIIDEDMSLCPVFCMYSVEVKRHECPPQIRLMDERLSKFGRYAVVITDVKEFIDRVRKNLPEFTGEAVRYIDMKNPKGVDEFAIFNPIVTKDKYFKYQREFRIYSHSWSLGKNPIYKYPHVIYVDESACKFPVGSLRDIAQQFSTVDLFSGITIPLQIDWDFCHKNKFMTNLPLKTQ